MSDVVDDKNFQGGDDGSKRGKKRRSKKKKQRKPIAEIDFGNGTTSANASKVAMEVEKNDVPQTENNENVPPSPDGSPVSKRVLHKATGDEDGGATEVTETTTTNHEHEGNHEHGSTATDAPAMEVESTEISQTVNDVDQDDITRRVVHKVETGDDGEVLDITETTTIRHEGGDHHKHNDDDKKEVDVGDLEEGESTILVDLQHEGNVLTETTTEMASGPVTVENYEEKLDDDTTVQVEHISQTLTTTKTIIITEDGQEVEVDANDPNVEYIEEEPEIITEEITQTIRRRKIITTTPDGREIETFEDVVVTDDEDAENEDPESVTTVTVTHDDLPIEGHAHPTYHMQIGNSAPGSNQKDDEPVLVNHDDVDDEAIVLSTEVKVPETEEDTIQVCTQAPVESELNFDDFLPQSENEVVKKNACVESDDEPAVHIELPPQDDVKHVDDHDERPRSTSYIINSHSKDDSKPIVKDTVKIYIRAEEPTPPAPVQEQKPKTTNVNTAAKQRPTKEKIIEKQSFGSRDGMDEWVLVNFKHDEVLAFIELLKSLPFNYDLSTEVPQSQCACW